MVSSYPTSTSFLRVKGWSMDPPGSWGVTDSPEMSYLNDVASFWGNLDEESLFNLENAMEG